MPKTFYTERDIEDLVRQGVRSLIVDEDVVLTDLAYEKARRLGLELLRENDKPPAAPVRPYIAKMTSPTAGEKVQGKPGMTESSVPAPAAGGREAPSDDLYTRVYEAAIARLGDSVDPKLLQTVIQRVLQNIKTGKG